MADPEAVGIITGTLAERAYEHAKNNPSPPGDPLIDLSVVGELEAERAERWKRIVPSRFRDAHVDQLDGTLRDLAARWTGTGMLANVLLLGSVGVGKTHAAVSLARLAHDQGGVRVRFLPVVELLDDMRPGGDLGAFDRAVTVDVLVLDDLGGERPTDWTGERLYALINRRWLEERPTIVTSNLGAAKLEASVGPRIWSRLWHDSLRIEIGGADRRRTA